MDNTPLAELAQRLAIAPTYRDLDGHHHPTSADTARALLTAMGEDVADDAAAQRSLDAHRAAVAATVVPPSTVRRLSDGADAPIVARLAGAAVGSAVTWRLTIGLEPPPGRSHRGTDTLNMHTGTARVLPPVDGDAPTLRVPAPMINHIGYHSVTLEVWKEETLHAAAVAKAAAGEPDTTAAILAIDTPTDWRGEGAWILVPDGCVKPETRHAGLCVNLYGVRSAGNWGIGDAGDLRALVEPLGETGIDFLLLNPLHALRNRWPDVSPYSPFSRLFRNPLYIEIEAVPGWANAIDVRDFVATDDVQAALARLRVADRVDYDGVRALKMDILARLHRALIADGTLAADADYASYREAQGALLDRFAVFCALEEHFRDQDGHPDWYSWPEPYKRVDSDEVAAFAEAHTEAVDFHRWLQFELDRQLGAIAARATEGGMAIGLLQDLAVGSAASGFDPWVFPGQFATGIDLGCPPDPLGPNGQNWALPSVDPNALQADGYRFWRALLRSAMQHCGALRIDHVLGLVRLFWIPSGRPGSEGAYVRMPTDDLLGILALESQRNGVVVVGEDLGTLPDGMAETLARWNVLSTNVLYFERDGDGDFLRADAHKENALLTVTTHDLPTVAAWWSRRDLTLYRDYGVFDEATHTKHANIRTKDLQRMAMRLAKEGLLLPTPEHPPYEVVARSIHAYLARSSARLVGTWLEDLVGETEPVNIPGLLPDRFPAWSRRLAAPLERILATPETHRLLRQLAARNDTD